MSFANLSAIQKGLVLVLVPVLFEIVFLLILANTLSQARERLAQIEYSKNAILEMRRTSNAVIIGTLTLATSSTNAAAELSELDKMGNTIFRDPQSLTTSSIRKNPELADLLDDANTLSLNTHKLFERARKVVLNPKYSDSDRFRFAQEERLELMNTALEARKLFTRILEVEQRVRLAGPAELTQLRWQLGCFLSAGILISAALSLGVALLFSNDIVRRLERIGDNARQLATTGTVAPPAKGRDEIAALQRVIYESSEALKDLRRKELSILDNAADVICSLDEHLKFIGISAAATKVWHYALDELQGRSLLSIIDRRQLESARDAFRRIAFDAAGHGAVELTVQCHDRSEKIFVWNVSWSLSERTYFCVAHDVSEARAVERLKQQFLAIVTHDLRSPLMSVGIGLEFLTSGKRGELPGPITKELERAKISMNRLVELVNELLELEKLEAGRLAMNLTCVSAADLCAVAAETLAPMALAAGVRIDGPASDGLLLGEDRRLVQVMTNLLSNAIKFSPPQSTVQLSVGKRDGLTEIRIADRGPGVPAAERALIFDRFRQSRATANLSTTVKGTGLGLAIVKAIVEAHRGQVGVESREGGGSIFWMAIPEYLEPGGAGP